jgi:hypothetical protein
MRRIEPKTLRLALGLALALPLAAAFAACSATAPTADEIGATFKEAVDAAKDCDDTDPDPAGQCVLVYPGCPLGQFEAVRRDLATSVDETARSLLRQYARKDQVCAYAVVEGEGEESTPVLAPDARCIENKCTVCRLGTNDCPSVPDPGSEPGPDAGE